MRIPCAKCGHLHDSTVTPFMYDIITEHPTLTNSFRTKYNSGCDSRHAQSFFKCVKCGASNLISVSWTWEVDNPEVKEEAANDPDSTDN